MSSMNFGAFLNGAVSGFETGMDLADKYGRYKQRKRDRQDLAATQDAIGQSAIEKRLTNQVAESGREKVVKPVVTTPARPVAFAAGAGAQRSPASFSGAAPAARVGVMPGRDLQRFPDYRR